jgi:signal transduction histidine kinase
MVRKSEQARRSAQQLDTHLAVATALALLLGGLASSSLTSRLLRPLSVLAQAARRIGQGDLEARAVVEGRDEVSNLASEFNEMANHLRQYRASSLGELLQAQSAAQSAIDSLPDAVVVFNADATVLSINDDLLDLSRLQSGTVELNRQPISAEALVEVAVDQVRAQAKEKQLELRMELLAGPVQLSVDPERLGLVFSNLLINAIRYSPPLGTVVVRARPGPGSVRFEVADSGPGIPPEYRERVFEKYFRVPGAASGSAGLGLYISREIVTAHGGEIGVQSEVGQGSTFWFTIPLPA